MFTLTIIKELSKCCSLNFFNTEMRIYIFFKIESNNNTLLVK